MVELLFEKIRNEVLKAFVYRAWNTFKSVILPIALPLILSDLEGSGDGIAGILHGHLWAKVGYSVLIALLGATIAGLDKVSRMRG